MFVIMYTRRRHIKTIVIICLIVFLCIRILYLCRRRSTVVTLVADLPNTKDLLHKTNAQKRNIEVSDKINMKYVLLWTPGMTPIDCIESGQDSFLVNNCEYINCFVTYNRAYLKNVTDFDAILFSIAALSNLKLDFPEYRSEKQKYTAVSREPAPKYPVMNPYADDVFNWTWTYRLDSDVSWKYLKIYDSQGYEIGPAKNIRWVNDSDAISEDVQDILFQKTKLVAWIVPDCSQKYRWDTFTKALDKALRKLSFSLDIYSTGTSRCGRYCGNFSKCQKLIENDYFFYLALETYFDPDYVTEVLLNAVNNYAIPIVLAGDLIYQSFLPPGSYIDASKLNPGALAHRMREIMYNYTLHQEFFKWTNNYYYESVSYEAEVCNLCTALNNDVEMKKKSVYNNFRYWWNGKPVLNIRDMVMSIFLKEPQMVNLTLDKNYKALLGVFEKKYIDDMRALQKRLQYERSVDFIFSFNWTTTDPNTADVNDVNDTTLYTDDDD